VSSFQRAADNVALPAFAAARLLLTAGHRPCSSRSTSPARRVHSSKPAAAWTDGQTDARPLHRPSSAYYTGSADTADCDLKKEQTNDKVERHM